ncbi:hypothetical protein B9Z55_000397 [Caenorhabditis nigoni]|uniref:Uncharacterized protein n=1 Tax=Caenorhabditis nigoni TaxID=1611254 RepID=A0A2G5VTA6_9PELO|nr:hypothetical protein B9Z55_000397 [Caenorhabditis nigoni]
MVGGGRRRSAVIDGGRLVVGNGRPIVSDDRPMIGDGRRWSAVVSDCKVVIGRGRQPSAIIGDDWAIAKFYKNTRKYFPDAPALVSCPNPTHQTLQISQKTRKKRRKKSAARLPPINNWIT